MGVEHESVKKMWKNYLTSIGEDIDNTEKTYISWYFCDDKKNADDLAELVLSGVKRATASLYYWYEAEGQKLPKVGEISIITNYDGIAQCVIKTTKLSIVPFNKVTKEFAKKEGEKDMSLRYWRKAHRDFFRKELKEKNIAFSDDLKVVCEEFDLVYLK